MLSEHGVLRTDAGLEFLQQPYRKTLHELAPGTITEMYLHPAIEGAEIEAVRRTWWQRGVEELRLFTTERVSLEQLIHEEGIIVIGWRPIRDLQRRGG